MSKSWRNHWNVRVPYPPYEVAKEWDAEYQPTTKPITESKGFVRSIVVVAFIIIVTVGMLAGCGKKVEYEQERVYHSVICEKGYLFLKTPSGILEPVPGEKGTATCQG